MIQPMATLSRTIGRFTGGAGSWLGRLGVSSARDSPTRLRLAAAATVLVSLVLSIGGWYGIDRRGTGIDDAAQAASQLILVQDVRVRVVQADSLASVAYLIGGQEPADQRREYDDRISEAAGGLTTAASAATRDDVAALERATALLTRYVGLVEQARANNRQGFPVGAAYQRQARGIVDEIVAALRSVESNSRARVNASMDRAHRAGALVAGAGIALLVAIALGSWWMARRWRRLLNVPLVVAAAIVLLVLTIGGSISASAARRADRAVSGPLTAADLLAQARAAGFDARSNEALTLIARGNGAGYEVEWQRSTSVVTTAVGAACAGFDVGCDASLSFDRYVDQHQALRVLDDTGDWDTAVAASTGDRGSAVNTMVPFDEFAAQAGSDVGVQADVAADGFDRASAPLGTLGLIVGVAGLATAALAVAGYGQRLREYR